MAMNLNAILMGAIGTLVSAILSVVVAFVVLIFLPLLNSSTFLTSSARTIIEDVYPIIIVLIPLMTFIGGMVVTVLMVGSSAKR